MPPKKAKGGKKKGGKKAAAKALAEQAAQQQAAAELEAKRRYEEEQAAREATLVLREEALAKRESDSMSIELEYKTKLEGIDAEVALRARSGIAAAEAREAASERRAIMRETECQQRESCFAAAERELAVRSIEIAAREAAMGENVIGGVAERLDKMLSEQAVTRDTMLTRHKEIERERAALKIREANWQEEVARMEATLAAKERETRAVLEKEERKMLQKDFTLKRRLARRVKEAEAIVEAHRAECAVRDRRLNVRDEEIKRRNGDLVLLLRKARKHELALRSGAKENVERHASGSPLDPPPWEPQRSPPSYVAPRAGEASPVLEALEESAANLRAGRPVDPETNDDEPQFYRPATPGKEAAAAPARNAAADEFKAVLRRVQAMEDELVEELRGFEGDPDRETDAVEAALKDVKAAERLIVSAETLAARPATASSSTPNGRPFAARRLPERPANSPGRPATAPLSLSMPAVAPVDPPPRSAEAWPEFVDGPAPAADAPDPVYTIRQHEFDIPEFDG